MNTTEKGVTLELHVFNCEASQLDYLAAHPCARLVGLVKVQTDRPQQRYGLIYHYSSAEAARAAATLAERDAGIARRRYQRNCRPNRHSQLQELI